MSEGLGLHIAPDHLATIERFEQTPISFRLTETNSLPPQWMSDIPCRSQGSFSCCVGGGLSGCFEHRQFVEAGAFIRHSMWQAYIESQRHCGMLGSDNGAALAGALKAAGIAGVAINDLCPMPSGYTTKIPQAAIDDAAKHKHLGDIAYDARNWDRTIDWITNKDPVLFGGIWTTTLGEMNEEDWIIKPRHLNGTKRGYHCTYLCGWTTIGGIIVPLMRNTHGDGFGKKGVVAVSREAWDAYMRDPYTVCLAFGDIMEREPKRRDWATESRSGDSC